MERLRQRPVGDSASQYTGATNPAPQRATDGPAAPVVMSFGGEEGEEGGRMVDEQEGEECIHEAAGACRAEQAAEDWREVGAAAQVQRQPSTITIQEILDDIRPLSLADKKEVRDALSIMIGKQANLPQRSAGRRGGQEGSRAGEARATQGEARQGEAAERADEGRACQAGATDLTVLVSEPLRGWPVEMSQVGALVVRGAVLVWARNHTREGICSGSPSWPEGARRARAGGEDEGDEASGGSGRQGVVRRMCSKSSALEAVLGLRITLESAEGGEGEQERMGEGARERERGGLGREDLVKKRGGKWKEEVGEGGRRRGDRGAREPCVLQNQQVDAEEWRCMEVTGAHAQVVMERGVKSNGHFRKPHFGLTRLT